MEIPARTFLTLAFLLAREAEHVCGPSACWVRGVGALDYRFPRSDKSSPLPPKKKCKKPGYKPTAASVMVDLALDSTGQRVVSGVGLPAAVGSQGGYADSSSDSGPKADRGL